MSTLKTAWTRSSKQQFDQLRQRAAEAKRLGEFIDAHNEIAAILRDVDRAVEKGEPLYNTQKPGGVVRHFLHDFVSVTYAIFAAQGVGWIIAYLPVPSSWPEPKP